MHFLGGSRKAAQGACQGAYIGLRWWRPRAGAWSGASDLLTLALLAELVRAERVRPKAGLVTGLLLEWEPNDSNAVPVSVDEIRVRQQQGQLWRWCQPSRRQQRQP